MGNGSSRIELIKLMSASLFSGEPNVNKNAKSLVGRIPIGTMSNNPSHQKPIQERLWCEGSILPRWCIKYPILVKKFLAKPPSIKSNAIGCLAVSSEPCRSHSEKHLVGVLVRLGENCLGVGLLTGQEAFARSFGCI